LLIENLDAAAARFQSAIKNQQSIFAFARVAYNSEQ
jgi:hypothetical protein